MAFGKANGADIAFGCIYIAIIHCCNSAMYQTRITEIEIVDGEKKIARINNLANGAFALKVLSGADTNWTQLTEAIIKSIQLLDQHEPTKN